MILVMFAQMGSGTISVAAASVPCHMNTAIIPAGFQIEICAARS
jgi:hypothetical protein